MADYVRLNVRITQAQMDALQRIQLRRGTHLSELVRAVLSQYFCDHPPPPADTEERADGQ